MRSSRWLIVLTVVLLVLAIVTPIAAQESGIQITTPYVGVVVEAGDTASFDLSATGPEGTTVEFEMVDLPDQWGATVRGGGFVVEEIILGEGLDHRLELEVDVPADATEGTYTVSMVASSAAGDDRLDFSLTVGEAVAGGVALAAEFPALQGPSDVTFSFNLELANDTTEEIQFGLQTEGPPGWQLEARPSGQSRASTVTIQGGETERITVEVDPPDFTAAGTYPVVVRAAGSGQSATAELVVDITGNFGIALLSPDDRLNLDVEAGSPTEMQLLVLNEGTAPLNGVSLSATPPRGWEVTFEPESIDRMEAGASVPVAATVTASEEAITGDYRITMRANVPEVSDEIEVRATVETPTIWGLAGVGLIIVALGALVLVFRRFGRR